MNNKLIREQRLLASRMRRKIKMMVADYIWKNYHSNLFCTNFFLKRVGYSITDKTPQCIKDYRITNIIRENGKFWFHKLHALNYSDRFIKVVTELLEETDKIDSKQEELKKESIKNEEIIY